MKKLIVVIAVLAAGFIGFNILSSKPKITGPIGGHLQTSTAKGKIAFTVKHGDERHIHIMNADGTGDIDLVNCLNGECYPSWSPDGNKIVFERHEDGAAIYIVNADGSNMRRVSGPNGRDVRPSWSPDATKIIYTHVVKPSDTDVPETEVNVMNADGTNIKTILRSENGTFNVEPRYSPDGSKIAFMRGKPGVGQHIYVMNSDGTNLKQITDKGANGDPVWSPDGSRISFGSNREGGGKLNVFTSKPDGSDVRQITHLLPPYEAGDTTYSPDGSLIAFEADVSGKGQSDPNASAEVWIVKADGTGEPMTTHKSCSSVGCSPRWKPIP